MKQLMFLTLGITALGFLAMPIPVSAQLDDVNDAVAMLTDAPTNGKRTTVDLTKRWGADVGVTDAATAKLQSARGSASGDAARLLDEAVAFGKSRQHKEARLRAQGAQYYLCQGSAGSGCEKVPKFGSYFP